MRAETNHDVVDQYLEDYLRGDKFPPLDVFDDGKELWLADGFTRFHAAQRAGMAGHECNIHKGDLRAAILFAIDCNNTHGTRLSAEDKRRRVSWLLNDDEWKDRSSNEISKKARVSVTFVIKMRKEMEVKEQKRTGKAAEVKAYVGKDGKKRKATMPRLPKECPVPEEAATQESAFDDEPVIQPAEEVRDALGDVVPRKCIPSFQDLMYFKCAEEKLDEVASSIRVAYGSAAGGNIDPIEMESSINHVKDILKTRKPYAVCPSCMGEKEVCKPCKSRGWVDKILFERMKKK